MRDVEEKLGGVERNPKECVYDQGLGYESQSSYPLKRVST